MVREELHGCLRVRLGTTHNHHGPRPNLVEERHKILFFYSWRGREQARVREVCGRWHLVLWVRIMTSQRPSSMVRRYQLGLPHLRRPDLQVRDSICPSKVMDELQSWRR